MIITIVIISIIFLIIILIIIIIIIVIIIVLVLIIIPCLVWLDPHLGWTSDGPGSGIASGMPGPGFVIYCAYIWWLPWYTSTNEIVPCIYKYI